MFKFNFPDTKKYQNWTRDLKKVRIELGLDMSPEQKLLISIAGNMCGLVVAAIGMRSRAAKILSRFEELKQNEKGN